MSENILFKEGILTSNKQLFVTNYLWVKTKPSLRLLIQLAISSSIVKVANEQKMVCWEDVINDLKELIKENYDGKSFKVYRGDWKRKIKLLVRSMGYKLEKFDEDIFVPLSTTKNEGSLCTKSTGSNYKLTASENERVIETYNNIPITAKWVLSTGKVVDDVMKKLAEKSCYEHPVHSMILEPDDPIWKSYFTNC